jgi:hypothetical protein
MSPQENVVGSLFFFILIACTIHCIASGCCSYKVIQPDPILAAQLAAPGLTAQYHTLPSSTVRHVRNNWTRLLCTGQAAGLG